MSPLLVVKSGMNTEYVKSLAAKLVAEAGAFLVNLNVGNGNQIHLQVEHPQGATLERLAQISRQMEKSLDREEEDFSIEVSSPGVGEPLKVKQQYSLNIGRKVQVILNDGEVYKGTLVEFDENEENITLQWKERVKKEVGKGKKTVELQKKLPLQNIKQTAVEVSF